MASKAGVIRLLDKNNRVLSLQNILCRLGFQCDKDGVFGQNALACVVAFQKTKHISADGIVGRKTIDKMFLKRDVVLKIRDRNTDVAVLQLLLAMHNKQVIHDGIFGRGTHKALEAVQRMIRTKVDGVFGPKTRKLMT